MKTFTVLYSSIFMLFLMTTLAIADSNSDTGSSQDPNLRVSSNYSSMNTAFFEYINFAQFKAFAYAINANQDWVYGRAWGYENQTLANQEALDQCEETRETTDVVRACKIFSEGDNLAFENLIQSGTVYGNLDIYVPSLNYQTFDVWADLEYSHSDSSYQYWRLRSYGPN